MNTSTIVAEAKKTRNRQVSDKPRASQTIYVVRKGDKLHYVGKDEAKAKAESAKHCSGIKPEEYGSRASLADLAPTVVLDTWFASPNLASLHTSIGGQFGARSQNDDNKKRVATVLAKAFGHCGLPIPVEFPDGTWTNVSTAGGSKGPSADEVKRIAEMKAKYAAKLATATPANSAT